MTRYEQRPEQPHLDTSAETEISWELIEYHVRYGNHLRAATMAAWAMRIGRSLGLVGRAEHNEGPASMAERFATGLTTIRSSAEVLRDAPDLSPAERARFVRSVLEAERQLEEVLADLRRDARRPLDAR